MPSEILTNSLVRRLNESLRRLWLLAIMLCCTHAANAQTYWASRQQGGNVDETLGVTGDAAGNAYATGYFSTLATISDAPLSSAGLTDVFLTKVNADGTPAWSVKAGGALSDRGLGVATTPDDEVVICGFFTGSASFGDGVTLTANANSQDAFVAKYDADGNVLWAKAGGSVGSSDRANAVTTDADGNVFITGQYTGNADFGPFTLMGTGTTNEVFVVKYSPNGNELWARSGNGPALNRGLGITTDDAGAVYACGQFSGNITFENLYPNSIQNALFVVKYLSDGTEAWMRYGGGAQQSIAYDIVSNGTEVFLTGDCGESIVFANAPGLPELSTGFEHAVFVASFSGTGNVLWSTSQGSSSPVSGRGISYHAGELAVASWFECTFDELSAAYGPTVFNNAGFRDIAIMRFDDSGNLLRAQQFGSHTSEVPSAIHILPEGLEIVGGTYTDNLVMPVTWALSGPGFELNLLPNQNPGLTYCGDPNYGEFRHIIGSGAEDGFMVKAVDPLRAPYDYYIRTNQGSCDLSEPEACIVGFQNTETCSDTISGCPFLPAFAQNFVWNSSFVGYDTEYSWSPGGGGSSISVNTSGLRTVVMTSSDGCYADTAQVYMNVHPLPDPALISDDLGVNTLALNPEMINLCPGEEVTLWATSPESGSWNFAGQDTDTITVNSTGDYEYTVSNGFGCSSSNLVYVNVEGPPPPLLDPIMDFSPPGDTISICQGDAFLSIVFDQITGMAPDHDAFIYDWAIGPTGGIGGDEVATTNVPTTGWYTITVDITTDDGSCWTDSSSYQISDSVYVVVNPNPTVSISIDGPQVICPGDTVWLDVTSSADSFELSSGNAFIGNEDSVGVFSPGPVVVFAFEVNEFGCDAEAFSNILVQGPSSPVVSSNPDPPVVCPEGTVLLSTATEGEYLWFGPSGETGTAQTTEVGEVGLYYVVVEVYPGCSLVSNTLQVVEYATPFLISTGSVICPDSATVISVFPQQGGNITWQPPLTGSSGSQVVDAPGVYEATVESCGISTSVSIEITQSDAELSIALADSIPVCPGDSMLVTATSGFVDLSWSPEPAGANSLSSWYFDNATVQATAIDMFGCPRQSNVLPIALNVPPMPPEIIASPPCEGQTALAVIDSPFNIVWLSAPGGDTLQVGPSIDLGILNPDTTVYAFLSNEYCPGEISAITMVPKPLPEVPVPLTTAPVCTGTTFELEVLSPQPDVIYLWSGPLMPSTPGALITVNAFSMEMEGTYAVVPQLDGCVNDSAFIDVTLIKTVEAVLPGDTTVCEQSNFVLAPDTIFAAYIWQDGSTDSVYFPASDGVYTLITTDFNGCESVAISDFELLDCSVVIPNIFTPNGDGINDFWVISILRPQYFKLDVYNRWGRTVYESDKVNHAWDGTNFRNGEPCPDGVYFYIGRIVGFDSAPYELTGTITLARD